jgi:hypothetical protein
LAHKSAAAFSQCSGGFFLNIHQTTCITGLVITQSRKSMSTFFSSPLQVFQEGNQIE